MLQELFKPILENAYFVKFGLIGLFFNGLLASIIPIPTEITSSALLLAGQNQLFVIISLASGITLGGVVSYVIGRNGNRIYRIFNNRQEKSHEKSLELLRKYGIGIIFVAGWIPIVGDAVTIVAGLKKYDFKKFVIAMSIGKTTHAVAIVYFSKLILSYFNYFRF